METPHHLRRTALILMYHDIAEDFRSVPPDQQPYVLEPKVFHRQMQAVVESEVAVQTVHQWCATPREGRTLVLTFDDGHVSNHTDALPVLAKLNLPATFFVTAGLIGKGETMSWAQIRELHAAGMEIGSHTLTHRPPALLTDTELEYELLESRKVLENGLGAPVTSISSPTGFFNPRMRRIAVETGYQALCIGRVGFAPVGGDRFSLNRVAIKHSMTERQFKRILSFDRLRVASMRSHQRARELARSTLGHAGYLLVRRLMLARGIFNR